MGRWAVSARGTDLIVCIDCENVAEDFDLDSDEIVQAPEKIDCHAWCAFFFVPFYEDDATWEPGNFPLYETGRDVASCVTRIFPDAMAAVDFVDRLNPVESS